MSKTPEQTYPEGPLEVVVLEYPITRASPPIREVKFWRRFTVDDLIKIDDLALDGVARGVDMLRRLTLLSTADLKLLDAYDYTACDEVMARFLVSGRPQKTASSDSR